MLKVQGDCLEFLLKIQGRAPQLGFCLTFQAALSQLLRQAQRLRRTLLVVEFFNSEFGESAQTNRLSTHSGRQNNHVPSQTNTRRYVLIRVLAFIGERPSSPFVQTLSCR